MSLVLNMPATQNEIASLISRWRLSEPVGSAFVTDDVGGIRLLTIGAPTFSLPSMTKDDAVATSVMGANNAYFSSLGVAAYTLSSGLTLEATTKIDPLSNAFNILAIPGQTTLRVSGADVIFDVWIGTVLHSLTATGVLLGWPQHVVATYDTLTALQVIYVDGARIDSAGLSGSVGTTVTKLTTGTTNTASLTITAIPSTAGMQAGGTVTGAAIPASTTIVSIPSSSTITINNFPSSSVSNTPITVGMPVTIAQPTTASATQVAAQDVAIYGAPLSAKRIAQHYQVLRQIRSDPRHVRAYPQIGVYV